MTHTRSTRDSVPARFGATLALCGGLALHGAERPALAIIESTDGAATLTIPHDSAPDIFPVEGVPQFGFDELNDVLGNFGNSGVPGIVGDVNNDGLVDFDDLNYVLGNFGTLRGDSDSRAISPTFSMFAWVYRAQADEEARSVLSLPGVLDVRVNGHSSVTATLHQDSAPASVTLSAPVDLPAGQWSLIAVSYNSQLGRADLFVRSDALVPANTTLTTPAWAGSGLGPITGDMAIGAVPDGPPGMIGAWGLMAFRIHHLAPADVDAVFASRRYLGPYDHDNTSQGGLMTGFFQCRWMLNHAMTTRPGTSNVGGTVADHAATVGMPATIYNTHIFNRVRTTGNEVDDFAVVRAVTSAAGFTYRSFAEPPYDGFFMQETPVTPGTYPPSPIVAPLARQIATGPEQLLRVMVSANSRGIRINDGSGLSAGNYAHGFIDLLRPQVAGVLNRPATDSGSRPWFGFDTTAGAPLTSGVIIQFDSTNTGTWRDFSRFFTGSAIDASRGPGTGLVLRPGATYAMLCRPEAGSLLAADAPLETSTALLKFPGASAVTWRPNRAQRTGLAGTLGAATKVALDTTTHQHTITGADAMSAQSLTLALAPSPAISVGDAVFVATGTATGAISIVAAIDEGPSSTTITLEHPLGATPGAGAVLKFGPWDLAELTHLHGPVSPGNPETSRGMKLEAAAGGAGVVVLSHSAARPDVNGFAFGTAGWGGNGYSDQLAKAFDGSVPRWAALTRADVWIVAPAQQNSTPDILLDFTALVREGLPGAEIVWACEGPHPAGSYPEWATYISANASANGAAGIVAYDDPRVGTSLLQLADGHRSDAAHISARGNRKLAEVWRDLLLQAALPE